jgi:hypothetical protein
MGFVSNDCSISEQNIGMEPPARTISAAGVGSRIGCRSFDRVQSAQLAGALMPTGRGVFWLEGPGLVEQLIAAGTTLPAIAGILESKRPSGVAFLDLLSKELYRDFPFHEVVSNEDQRRELVKFVQDSNSTMRSVAALCARKGFRHRIRFKRNDACSGELQRRFSPPHLCSSTVWHLPLPHDRERVQTWESWTHSDLSHAWIPEILQKQSAG